MPNSTIASSVATTTSLAFADIGNARADVNFNVGTTTDCWTLHVLLTDQQFQLIQSARVTLTLKVFRTDNPDIRVNSAGDFLARSPVTISLDALSQGYGACRFPAAESDEPYVTGRWTARLIASGSFGGIDVAQIPIWLVERRIQVPSPRPAGAFDSFSLPVRFVLVTPQAKLSAASGLLTEAINYFWASIYAPSRLTSASAPEPKYVQSTKTYGSDLRSGDLAALVAKYQSANTLTVFSIVNLDISVEGGIGFAMLTGPQGFACTHSAIISRMQPDSIVESASSIGTRMAHEVGHYLGLIHETACLESPATSGDVTICRTVLGNPNDPRASTIRGNLMYTSRPGNRLRIEQRYQLLRSPSVHRSFNMPKTQVTKLVVKVHTGHGVRDFWDFTQGDGAGTDDNVSIDLIGARGEIYSSDVSSNWNDFEQGANCNYQLNPGSTLYEEDITGFRIRKSINRGKISILGKDHWLFQGLIVTINDRVWYSNDDIHKWLVNDGTGPSGFSGPLSRPVQLAVEGSPANVLLAGTTIDPAPPAPFYVTPPFSTYPLALQFTPGAHAYCATAAQWADLMGATSHFSFQAWIKPADAQTEQAIVVVGNAQTRVFLRIKAGSYEFGVTVAGQDIAASAAIPVDDINHWIHICGAYDGANWTIHRNGAEMVQTHCAAVSVTGTFFVGTYDGASGFFSGQMRNVAIWRSERTVGEELRDLFSIDLDDANLAAYWPLDDGQGDVAYDASVGAHDLTATAATWYIPAPILADTLFLPASPQSPAPYVTVTGAKLSTAFTDANTTICGWFRIGGAADMQWERVLASNDVLVLRVRNGNYEFGLLNSSADLLSVTVAAGDLMHWVHIVGQYDAAAHAWILIRNGHQIARQPAAQGYSGPTASSGWTFGGRAGGPSIPNTLEMRLLCLFHGVVSIDQLRTIYMTTGGVLPQGAQADGLVGYWPVDDGAGSTLYDLSVPEDDPTAANGEFDGSTMVWTESGPISAMVFVGQGQSIATAVAQITDAGPNKPYTLYVGPGVFGERVRLPAWCSLVGAGEAATEITAEGVRAATGTLELCGSQVIRQITATSSGGSWGTTVAAIGFNNGSGVLLENVTAHGVNVSGQGVNIRLVGINAVGTGQADKFSAISCTFKLDTAAWGSVVLAFGADVVLQGCTIIGGLRGFDAEIGELRGRTSTLYKCAITSPMALHADSSSSITAHGCQITGSSEGNVVILPS
ncbi:LamG-like jellyroll fold domain-containing protein [Pseudomonas viridiflava]|uniref:LamG-like jellyroll fold domain-containing protein n=1 Tax=Pseudomonas viridiflava TaxID=33069 RepID=UPI002EAE2BA5|nr:LamG-like jellyroll fold domain-containing protein [Pseudomonas viridiflava]